MEYMAVLSLQNAKFICKIKCLDEKQKSRVSFGSVPVNNALFSFLFGQYPDALRCTGRQKVACGRPVRSTYKNLRRIYRLNQAFNA